ncbi:glycerate kinase [Sanguibacter gelidistatuariae]|uniref:Glycerate kinase n=1 Tax=Sanguibacter gelidistatuariae TaxID=1814289 RepID=A0A1G6RBF6_9MICO|nr:glycerate kinase [Sanguibacter gelidistatuariae]SDD01415.1 glycerate kinase [Sanguibacter gelidistatuariae]
MHVLIAPDRFAGADTDSTDSTTSTDFTGADGTRRIGAALVAGWLRGATHDTVDLCPLSDGGPGFAGLLAQACGWAPPDADGVLGVAGARTAYIDSAVALAASSQDGSAPVAAQIERAIAAGATRIVVGLGTPTDLPGLPDAGAGLLAALGVRGLGARGLGGEAPRPDGLGEVLDRLRGIDLVAATATDIPLLGLHGASAGAADAGASTREAAQQREREIGRVADALWQARERARAASPSAGLLALAPAQAVMVTPRARDLTALPGAGAGGGLGFALALLGARLLPGATVYAQVVGLTARAQSADLVITAREDLDGASFHGSGVEQAALAASGYGIACVALAERSMMNRRELAAVGLSASYPLRPDGAGSQRAESVEARAGAVAERVARSWSPSWSGAAPGPS